MTASATRIQRYGSNVGHNMLGTLDDEVVIKKGGGGAATFDVTFNASGAPAINSAWTVTANYTASPTAQTNAVVQVYIIASYTNSDGTFPAIWGVGWTSTTGWAASAWTQVGNGWYSTLTNPSLGTSGPVGTFAAKFVGSSYAIGQTAFVENDYSVQSHTDTATSPIESIAYTITA